MKNKGSELIILAQPDPPDAFVTLDGRNTWIEITDAFFNASVAKSITSYAASNMTHTPSDVRKVIDPDGITSESIENVILQKLNKPTMKGLAKTNGKGILLVGLFGPFFDIHEAEENFSDNLKNELKAQKVFSDIYFYEICPIKKHVYHRITV